MGQGKHVLVQAHAIQTVTQLSRVRLFVSLNAKCILHLACIKFAG